MMNWLICNHCLQNHTNGVKTYNITSCLHLLCSNCITPDDTVCTKCNKKCAVIQLNSRTPERIKSLFTDISTERVARLKQVLDIQRFHHNNLSNYYKNLHKKYKKVKDLLITNEKNANILWHKYQESKSENALLKRKLIAYEEQMANSLNNGHSQQNNFSSVFGLKDNRYAQVLTPRRSVMNVDSSVFVSPSSILTKSSTRSSGGFTDACATPYSNWGPKIIDPSSYATPKPMCTPMNTPQNFL